MVPIFAKLFENNDNYTYSDYTFIFLSLQKHWFLEKNAWKHNICYNKIWIFSHNMFQKNLFQNQNVDFKLRKEIN